MDHDEAMDETTTVPVEYAEQELLSHGIELVTWTSRELLAVPPGEFFPHVVCEVADGEVSSKKVLEWLGY